ncbi:MAG: hypothetical protein RLZZ413_1654, partial [Pseudomonadota bacterium]
VGEDADDIGAPLDLAIQSLDGVRRMQLGSVFLGEGCVSACNFDPLRRGIGVQF